LMPSLTEGKLKFVFPDRWLTLKLDQSSFYRNQFQQVCGGSKAVEILAVQPNVCVWLIEVKDYRLSRRSKAVDLADEIAAKVRDSVAMLVAANLNANDTEERAAASAALKCRRLKVVLHLEQPEKHSAAFPRVINPANVRQQLRQLIKAIDAHPLVTESSRMSALLWSVQHAKPEMA
jgi:hypothetical protein